MRWSLNVLCALLVVVAVLPASAPFVGGAEPGVETQAAQTAQVQPLTGQNTSSVLLLTGDLTAGQARSTVDVAPVVGTARGIIEIEMRKRIVENRLREANTVERRRQVLRQETEALSELVATLQRSEQRAFSQYQRGEISDEELLRTLARVDREARRADELTRTLQDEVAQLQFLSGTASELQSLQVELATMYGPVRTHADAVLRGEEPPTRIHLTVSGDAIALAMVHDGNYVREVTDPSNLDSSSEDRFTSENEVIDRISELYPWAWSNDISSVRTYTNFENGFYRINVDHPHGQLTSYVDGSTKNVFREIQYKSLNRMPVGDSVSATANGTTLVVNQSFVGGPVEVEVTDAVTGNRVAGTVYVEGVAVGRTASGHAWILGPAAQYEVTVETSSGNVTVTGQALQAPG